MGWRAGCPNRQIWNLFSSTPTVFIHPGQIFFEFRSFAWWRTTIKTRWWHTGLCGTSILSAELAPKRYCGKGKLSSWNETNWVRIGVYWISSHIKRAKEFIPPHSPPSISVVCNWCRYGDRAIPGGTKQHNYTCGVAINDLICEADKISMDCNAIGETAHTGLQWCRIGWLVIR